MNVRIFALGRAGGRRDDSRAGFRNTWQRFLCGFIVWTQFLCLSSAQFDRDGDHVCRDLKTGSYRCCDGFYPLDGTCVECAAGWYGNECRQKCNCFNGAKCDGVTGQCSCPTYWDGPQCTSCQVVPHMDYCRTKCLYCYNGHICDPIRRRDCLCAVGWRGDYCDQPCAEGSYGNNCENRCNPGFQGQNCSEPCPTGYYGYKCGQCPVCVHGVCDSVLGCLCDPGYTGDRCEELCPDNSYGGNCLYQCSCANDGECDHVSGNCTCKDSYSGTNCQFYSDSKLFQKHVKSLHVLMYVLVGVLNVVLVISLILYRREVKLRMASCVSRFKGPRLQNEDDQIEFGGIPSRGRVIPPDETASRFKEYHDVDEENEETTLPVYRDEDGEDETSTLTEYTRLKAGQ
ncbi:multiple epidermal growth factor-like domains protein 10 [Ptychodera flava]|uniref:multiple epidermal growth factor-like domains protein 10 n=1 Tax=Ptychodera flava TaxID=63121 RepID=UPI00396A2028